MKSNGSTRQVKQAKCLECGQTAGYSFEKVLVWKDEDLMTQ